MKKYIFLSVAALSLAAFFIYRPESAPSAPRKSSLMKPGKQVFLGKRKSFPTNSQVSLACPELSRRLDDLDMSIPAAEIIASFEPASLKNCGEPDLKQQLKLVDDKCFAKKSNHDYCVHQLLFLRSLLRIKNHPDDKSDDHIADLIIAEFSKAAPDFKKLQELSEKMLGTNPTPAVQKLWAQSRFLSRDKAEDLGSVAEEIYGKVDPSLFKNDQDMEDLELLMKTRFEVSEIEKHYREILVQDPADIRSLEMVGWTLWKQNRREEAIDYLERAVKANPGDDWLQGVLIKVKSPQSDENSYPGRFRVGIRLDDLFS